MAEPSLSWGPHKMRIGACRGYKLVYSLFFALILSLLAIAGCGGAASSGPGTPQKVLVSIAASPATADISVGASEQFHATATYSDSSTADVTAAATWTDANGKVATITPAGMATALAAGSTTITATMDSISGSASLTVPAVAKTVTAVAVTPRPPPSQPEPPSPSKQPPLTVTTPPRTSRPLPPGPLRMQR